MHKLVPRAYSILIIKDRDRRLVGRTIIQGWVASLSLRVGNAVHHETHTCGIVDLSYYKFSSRSSVDEDSNVVVAHLLNEERLAAADRCILTEKANGKCAVVTMCMVNGQRYLFGGSKVLVCHCVASKHTPSELCGSPFLRLLFVVFCCGRVMCVCGTVSSR